jgi:hypothetical protein
MRARLRERETAWSSKVRLAASESVGVGHILFVSRPYPIVGYSYRRRIPSGLLRIGPGVKPQQQTVVVDVRGESPQPLPLVARLTHIESLPNYSSNDFGKVDLTFPHWRRRFFPGQPDLDCTPDQIIT